ncbi:MAG: M23 family metallopeptidase [Oscillospiraceae bacterium]|nr:M23 family metallopeptidase [Oscillospiraceae bacterium]
MERHTNRKSGKARHTPPKGSDYLVRVISVQITVCVLVFALALICSKVGGDSFSDAVNEYKRLTENDLTMEKLKDAITEKKDGGQSAEATTIPADTTALPSAPLEDDTDTAAEEEPESFTGLAYEGQDSALSPMAFSPIENSSVSAILQSLIKDGPVVPVANSRITSTFGYRNHPITGENHLHTGTDFGADEGDRVMAVLDGKVTKADYSDARGYFIVLQHANNMETYYCHNSKLLVKEGTVVRAGETIALAGSTGDSNGPHVHLEVHINGEPKDPMKVLFTNNEI